MVDADGRKEPVRVTFSDGFDGLPVPSPDGTQLAWTSSRGGGREGQIFLAQWNHERARAAIAAAPPQEAPMTTQPRVASPQLAARPCACRARRLPAQQTPPSTAATHVADARLGGASRAARPARPASGGRATTSPRS